MPSTFNAQELLDRVDNDDDFLRETVEMLASDGPDLFEEIRAAAAANDAPGVAHSAHTLKGMISNFCAPDAHEAALAIEQMGRNGDLNAVNPALDVLEARLTALIEEINAFVAGRD